MKKYIITLFVSLTTIFSYGQSVYMHEAQQEAEENGISFGETILGAILFFGVIYVISKLSYRKSDSEHNHISNINPYDYSMDEKDWEEEERQERDWKIKSQILDEIEDINRIPNSYNSLDLTPIKSTTSQPQYNSDEEFYQEMAKGELDKMFPKGSIADALRFVSKEEFVDLGLSVRWSSKNIGASNIWDCGFFFRWASLSYIETFEYEKISEYSAIPYPIELAKFKSIIYGDEQHDAAYKISKGTQRLPSKEELSELLEKCSWKNIELENYKGYIVTGPTGKSIYLPLIYRYFINCMSEVMMTVHGGYRSGNPDTENKYNFEENSSFVLLINNKNNKTDDFSIEVDTLFNSVFSSIRGVAYN